MVWLERLGQPYEPIAKIPYHTAMSLLNHIAGLYDTVINAANPLLDVPLPGDGSRFSGQIPPVTTAPTFSIRKHTSQLFSLERYVADEIITAAHAEAIRLAVAAKLNIVVMGGTGSGKTTLTNTIIEEIVKNDPNTRLGVLEDTRELRVKCLNNFRFTTTKEVDLSRLVMESLRMRPDRIIIGEIRGYEAYSLLQAWNTGHGGGVVTVHANNCQSALKRICSLATGDEHAPRVGLEELTADGVHVIVNIQRDHRAKAYRRVLEIQTCWGYDAQAGGYILKDATPETLAALTKHISRTNGAGDGE